MDAKSIERVVRGAVSTVLTRIVERRQTSGNGDRGDNSESEVEDHQPAIQNQKQLKRRYSYS